MRSAAIAILGLWLLAKPVAIQAQPSACCIVTAIDTKHGLGTAKITAVGVVFQFKSQDGKALSNVRVGQKAYADFAKHQLSLDGQTICCTIEGGSSSPTVTPAGAAAPTTLGNRVVTRMPPIPTFVVADPQPAHLTTIASARHDSRRWEAHTVTAVVGGRRVTATLLHLRGIDGIEQAPGTSDAAGLSDGARRLLAMHVRTLRPGESDHYVVNPELLNAWVSAHPVPSDIKPRDTDTHSGCSAFSMHCAGEAAQHAGGQVSKEWQKAWEQAVADWRHAVGELSKAANLAEECWADHTVGLQRVPLHFATTNDINVPLQESGSQNIGGVSASGTLSGSIDLGLPMRSDDFEASIVLFYIPCLPGVVRPDSISGTGSLTIGEALKASVTATGKFDKSYRIPPTGGPRFPIYVIPIMAGDVPVAELDLSAYIEGDVELGGSSKAHASFEFDNPHTANLDFACSGAGCWARLGKMSDSTHAAEGAQVQGQVFVRPSLFTALQLDFDIDALTARAGPQPYLLGTASGCASIGGTQTSGGSSTTTSSQALVADVDWGVGLRAEALIADQAIGKPWIDTLAKQHAWFRDLAPGGSTALVTSITTAPYVAPNKPATMTLRLPSCYPYTDAVQYHVVWTGPATPVATSACRWQSGEGLCTAEPAKPLQVAFVWSASGAYTVSAVLVGDAHKRVFAPAPKPTVVTISVTAAAAGSGGAP